MVAVGASLASALLAGAQHKRSVGFSRIILRGCKLDR